MRGRNVEAIVAGAGIWGCTVARRLAEAGKKVLVLEKRPAVGGNVRCETDPETGIEVHSYGSHIFHTHIPEVWEFVNRFVTFNGYQHKVLAWTRATPASGQGERGKVNSGRMYHLPLGLTLINKFFGVELNPSEVEPFLEGSYTPLTTNNQQLTTNRRQAIFDAFFRGYTSKQWGKAPEDIDPSIIQRVPVRSNYDTNYFNDYNQGIPTTGYNSLFDRLLDHANITVQCNCELALNGDEVKVKGQGQEWINPLLTTNHQSPTTYYSGPLDALFNYKYGALPWRTLRFERETLDMPDYQGTSVVNYPDIDVPYTRIHEFAHYHPESNGVLNDSTSQPSQPLNRSKTVIMREYSAAWKPGDEPYYPINTPESAALLAKYESEVESFNSKLKTSNSKLIIGGRLGQYKYFDMDKSIAAALEVEI